MIKSYKISLIQTFFIAVNLLYSIRRLQNQNLKIGPKISNTIEHPCLYFLFYFSVKRNQQQLSAQNQLSQPANMISFVHKRAEYVIQNFKKFVVVEFEFENVQNITKAAKSGDF